MITKSLKHTNRSREVIASLTESGKKHDSLMDFQVGFELSSKVMTSQKWFFRNYGFYSIVRNNLSEKSSHAKKLNLFFSAQTASYY